MKKVVVVFPYSPRGLIVEGSADSTPFDECLHGQKTFEGKSLEVVNTDAGNLIIKEANGYTYAVFKHWINWENIE